MVGLVGAGALAYAGFAALCLATERGRRAVPGVRRVAAGWLRVIGWGLVAGSVWPALAQGPVGIGIVAWLGVLTVAAAPLTLGMGFAPRVVALAGPGVALVLAGVLAGVLPG